MATQWTRWIFLSTLRNSTVIGLGLFFFLKFTVAVAFADLKVIHERRGNAIACIYIREKDEVCACESVQGYLFVCFKVFFSSSCVFHFDNHIA